MLRLSLIILFSLSMMLSIMIPVILKGFYFEYAQIGMTDALGDDSQNNAETEFEEDDKTIECPSSYSGAYSFGLRQDCVYGIRDFPTCFSSILLPPPKLVA